MLNAISALSSSLARFLFSSRFFSPLAEEAGEPGLLQEIWEYLSEKYFSVKFYEHDYQHIDMSGGAIFSAQGVIIALALGVIVAAAISLFQKRTLGDLVRALYREDCFTPEKAMTFAELGMLRNAAVKTDLRHGTSLKRVVRCVEEEEYLAAQEEKRKALEEAGNAAALKKWREVPFTYDFETNHFYIPKELSYGADIQFDRRGTTPLTFLLVVVLCIVFAALACRFLPDLLQYVDNFLGLFGEG